MDDATRKHHSAAAGGPPETPAGRKERELARHRREVIAAAEKLLSDRPYHAISIQDIAQAAEFSVGYLYKLFPSKEDIYKAVILHGTDSIMAVLDETVRACEAEHAGFETCLTRVVHTMLAWMMENRAYIQGSLRDLEALSFSMGMHQLARRRYGAAFRRLDAIFQSALREGRIECESVEMVGSLLGALVWGLVRKDVVDGETEKDWTRYAPMIVRLIARGLAPEGGTR
ncbi:MAG: TetR/AcrR family transcriptional regulator [Candidatus Krumholzibacteriota bacterium]|nr:TetR/AcrR family transcriptional regulator [Candidatus Krumholzibacteriota bacterium]